MKVNFAPSNGTPPTARSRVSRRLVASIAVLGLAVFVAVGVPDQDDGRALRAAIAVSRTEQKYPILAACTRFDEIYDDLFYDDIFDDWPEQYHENVNGVIEEHLKNRTELDCEAEDYEGLLEPGEKMLEMAASLPPWKDLDDLAKLSATHVGIVLMEYLRVYECALIEYRYFLPIEISIEHYAGLAPVVRPVLQYIHLIEEIRRRDGIIVSELEVSRETLLRAGGTIGTVNRLRPLQAELECLQRASLDIRNATALSAEAAACVPTRTWDTKHPLRDLAEEDDE